MRKVVVNGAGDVSQERIGMIGHHSSLRRIGGRTTVRTRGDGYSGTTGLGERVIEHGFEVETLNRFCVG